VQSGFPISFGVFQNYYSQLPEFADEPNIAVVGTISQAMSYLGAPLVAPLVKRYPKYRRLMIFIGWPVCLLGLVAGSFATRLAGLVITQGFMYGLGFVILYYPIVSMVNEWWVLRRGMAFGIISSASGASGVVMPFVIEALLNRYGYQITMRATAVAMTLLTAPLLPLFKNRLPPAEQSAMGRTDWSFVRRPLFWVYSLSNVLQGLGFFFPALYLPSYASSLGFSAAQGALLLALMSIAQVLGQFTFGFLSDDRIPINLLLMLSTAVAAIASLTLWGLANSLASLVLFSLVYGFFGYGYVSMRVRMGTAVSDQPSSALATFSIFCFGQGVGNFLAGPISAALLEGVSRPGDYGLGRYRAVVCFTGACMLLSALSICSWYLRPRRDGIA
jgi:MFS family permease